MSIANIEKSKCCACLSCMNACPTGAISSKKDENGFIYPQINSEKCIECNLCEKVCGFNRENRSQNTPLKAYSLVHKDRTVLHKSTSGGAFTAFSDMILSKGGVIFGAAMDESFIVSHIEATDVATRDKMRGSLYVQSNTGTSYSKVKDYLEEGRKVLFVGTPCQTGGLKTFLRKPYDNLFLIEFLCHGVPNNDFFKEHVRYLEKKYSGKATWYTFRSKKYAWWTHGIEEITFEDGRKKATKLVQAYNSLFHSNVSLRPSCLNCTYRSQERSADITIADFWGIEKVSGEKNKTGISLVLGNTKKGISLIEAVAQNDATIVEIPYEKVRFRIATKPARARINLEDFWKLFHEKGYEEIVHRYTDNSLLARMRFGLKRFFARFF